MGRPLDPRLDRAAELYERGLSCGEVATVFGVTRQSIWASLKARGVQMRPHLRYGTDNHFYRGAQLSNPRISALVQKAEKAGILTRPDRCDECGEPDKRKSNGHPYLDAHHDDYAKPLEVRWLCQKCHFEWHKTNTARPSEPHSPASEEDLSVLSRQDGVPVGTSS